MMRMSRHPVEKLMRPFMESAYTDPYGKETKMVRANYIIKAYSEVAKFARIFHVRSEKNEIVI